MKKRVLTQLLNSPELLEALACVEHERWSNWEKYRESRQDHEPRWKRLRDTTYANLTEDEKKSDRVEARKSLAVVKEHLLKQAAQEGWKTAFMKFGLTNNTDAHSSVAFQRETTSPEGRGAMIDQAFNTNAQLGEYGQASDNFVSAVNNVMQPGPPAAVTGVEPLRHFTHQTDQSGGDL